MVIASKSVLQKNTQTGKEIMNQNKLYPAGHEQRGDDPLKKQNRSPVTLQLNHSRNSSVVLVFSKNFGPKSTTFAGVSISELCRLIDEEYHRVAPALLENAFEVIRWEQPALVLIDGNGWGVAHSELLARLKNDNLTADIEVVIWLEPSPASQMVESMVAAGFFPEKVVVTDKLGNLQESLKKYGPLYQRPGSRAMAYAAQSTPVAIDPVQASTVRLRNLLTDPELKRFVEQTVRSLNGLRLVSLFMEDPARLVNVESLWYLLGLEQVEAEATILTLGQVGLLEPLEFEATDPLWSLVAEPNRLVMLNRLEQALASKEYRFVLTSYLLKKRQLV
jgi:CheY-like chemotaxis protein